MTSWMVDLLAAGAEIAVELAFGVDPSSAPAGWTWTDVTGDVFEETGLNPQFGRSDEASQAQPGKCTFRLDNRSGAYSRGGESANWPNVRLGVPVRIRIDPDGSGFVVAWWGTVNAWKPKWPYHAAPYVDVEAAGGLRRLTQAVAPIESVFRRALSMDPHTVAYWPMEDGKDSAWFAPAVGTPKLAWPPGQQPSLASSSAFDGSQSVAALNKAELIASIPSYDWSSQFVAVRMLASFPVSGEPSGTLLAVWFNAASSPQINVVFFTYNSATFAIDMAAYDDSGSLITIQAGVAGSATGNRRLSFEFIQFGPSSIIAWTTCLQGQTGSGYTTYTAAGINVGRPWLVVVGDPVAGLNSIGVGHLAVQDGYNFPTGYTAQQNFLAGRDHWNAFTGEYADARISRLGVENDVPIQVMGASDTQMGPQSVGTLINVWRECETADGGALHDGNGMTNGLMYMTRQFMESRAADLTLSAQGDLVPPFEPIDDDRYIRNQATVTRTNGTTVTYTDDVVSVNGTAYIGTYPTSATVNLASDGAVEPYAQWMVNLSTYDGYRFGSVSLDLRRTKTYARPVLALMPGMRIDATNLSAALTSYPAGTTSLLVQGITQQLRAREWTADVTCSPYGPWQVGAVSPNTDGTAITFMGIGLGIDAVSDGQLAGFEVPLPGAAGVGDLLLIWATVRNSGTGTINVPSDWTALVTSGNCVLMGRFMRPGEPAPVLSVSNAVGNELALCQSFAFRGVYPDITACVHASAAQLNGATTNTIAFPGLTITQPNCAVVVATWKKDAWTGSSAIAGLTKMAGNTDTNGNDASTGTDYKIETTAANLVSGTKSITDATSSITRAVSIALLPATAPIFPERLDTPGSTLAASAIAGATSISVADTSATTVSYVNIGAAVAANNLSVVPTLPASIQSGDLLLCWATIRNTAATVNTPAGWKSLVSVGNCTLLGKYVQPGESPPTVSFAGGGAGDTTIAQILALRGTGQQMSTVVHASATQTNGSAQNVAYPGLTITQDDCVVLWFQWKQNAWTGKAPIAFEVSDTPSASGSGASIGIDYLPQTTASNATSGTDTVTGGVSAVSKAFVVAIKPHTSGVLWTTDSNDYPFDLSVGGIKVTATACSGTGTPQTMTISPASHALTSGTAVALWQPAGLSR